MIPTKSLISCAVFASVLLLVFQNGMALKCRNCLSSKSFDECEKMGGIVECNATIVNTNHETFKPENPTLPVGNWTEFKCYRFEVARLYPNNSDTGLRGYGRGCTFLQVNFCNGWSSSLNFTNCSTCTTDNCDENPSIIPTASPGVTTTTLPVTSTAPVNSSTPAPTSTKKPSNGANVLTLHNLSSLSFLGVLLLFAVQ
uniref:UPAR/Ly6 domain-containing protein n=1 Tax=Anopheles epiroticus TaxID=199890 RepID=A0A182PSZ2_9DIPT